MKTLSLNRPFTAAVAIVCLAACSTGYGQESSSWWPGANNSEPTASAPAAAPATPSAAPASGEGQGWLMNSPLVNIGWPEIKMPKIQWNTAATGGSEGPGFIATQTSKFRTMASNAATKTRASWNTALDKLRWNKPATAGTKKEPGFFARLLSPPQQPQGAETVAEFLAQDRPGTIKK